MSELKTAVDNLVEFYRQVTQPFSFPITLFDTDATAYVFMHSTANGNTELIPYGAHVVIVAEGKTPMALGEICIEESKLMSKKGIFHDDKEMFESVVDYIKRSIDIDINSESHPYIRGAYKNTTKPSWDNSALYKPAIASYNIVLAVLDDKYRNDDQFILDAASDCQIATGVQGFIDRILTPRKNIIKMRKDWFPEYIAGDIETIRETIFLREKENDGFRRRDINGKKSPRITSFLLSEMRKQVDLYRKMPLDWEILSGVTDDQRSIGNHDIDESWRLKYKRFALGPKVTVGKGDKQRVINPRREFFLNYPVIANSAVLMNDEFIKRLDNLEPIEGVRVFYPGNPHVDFKLTKSILKYLHGKHIKFGVFIEMFFMFLSHLPVEWMPELSDKPYSSTDEMDDFEELVYHISHSDYTYCQTVFDKIAYIKAIDCHTSDYLKKIYKAYTPSRHDTFVSPEDDKKYDAILAEFMDRTTLPRTISGHRKVMKSISREMKIFASERAKELGLPNSSRWLSDMKQWMKLRYLLIPKSVEVHDRLHSLRDSYDMFITKVVEPVAVLLSDKEDAISAKDNDFNKHINFFFGIDKVISLPKMTKISVITHEQGDYFIGAGNNPASLAHDGDESVNLFSLSALLEKDEIRNRANVPCVVEWLPIVLNSVTTPDRNFNIIPLMSAQQLVSEGAEMHHCVGWGGYANQSALGYSKIFSIRDEALRRVATLEVIINHDEKTISVAQLYGPYDKRVSSEVSSACAWFVDQVNKEKLPVNWDNLYFERESAKYRKDRESIISHKAGYLPNEEDIRKAMVPWKHFIPADIYNAPFSEWINYKGMKKLVEKINKQKPLEEELKAGSDYLDAINMTIDDPPDFHIADYYEGDND